MKWDEFKALLSGLDHKTPLGRIVAIRAENDKEVLKNFSKEQLKIRSDWRNKIANSKSENENKQAIENFEKMFLALVST